MKLFRAEEREAAEKREQERALRDLVTEPKPRAKKLTRADLVRGLRGIGYIARSYGRGQEAEVLYAAADMLEADANPNGEFPSS